MKTVWKVFLGASLGLTLAGAAFAKAKKEAVLWAAADVPWAEAKMPPGAPPHPDGAKPPVIAALWGDALKGAHGALVKFQGPVAHPLHMHSNDLKGVVVEGTFWIGAEGAEPKKLGPGSYFEVPGRWKHTSGCEGTCVLFQQSSGKFDMKPVDPAAKH